MPSKLTENVKAQQPQVEPIELRNFGGLSLKADAPNRAPTSWQQLNDCDLFIDGSVRAMWGWVKYGVAPTGAPYEAIFEFRATDNAPVQVWGYSHATASIARIDATGGPIPVAQAFGAGKTPWIGLLSGVNIPYTLKMWIPDTVYAVGQASINLALDGNKYVYTVTTPGTSAGSSHTDFQHTPAWTPTVGGTVTDNTVVWTNAGLYNSDTFKANWAVMVGEGGPMQAFNGTSVIIAGTQSPSIPPSVIPSSGPGLTITSGRFYAYTVFNPSTLEESDPTPLVGPFVFFATDINSQQGSFGSFLEKGGPYSSVLLVLPNTLPSPGSGFTNIRVYATHDGGSELFLVPTLYDASGDILTDTNSSVPLSFLTTSTSYYLALNVAQAKGTTRLVYDGAGSQTPVMDVSLITPAPPIGQNGPPPTNPIWGAVFQSCLWVVDSADRTKVWFTNPGFFDQFGVGNFILNPSKQDSSITGMAGSPTQLIVSTTRSLQTITGSDPATFARAPLDDYHGFVGKQMFIVSGSQLVGLLPQGIASMFMDVRFVTEEQTAGHMQLGFSDLELLGNDVQPLTAVLDGNAFSDIDSVCFDTVNNRVLFMVRSVNSPNAYCDEIISLQLNTGFHLIHVPPTGLRSIAEVAVGNETNLMILASDGIGQIWQLVNTAQADQSTVIAPQATTQALPLPEQIAPLLRRTQKVFRGVWLEGQNISDWTLNWSLDGGTTFVGTEQPVVAGWNGIGAQGTTLCLRFTRAGSAPVEQALISEIVLDWDIVGQTQR